MRQELLGDVIRQSLSQLRQLEKESVADYSYNVRNLSARLNLPRSRSEDKTLGFVSQQNDFDESGEMRLVIREEHQQIMSEEPRRFDCFSRRFRNHRNFICFDCSRNGHTQCYCTANTNSKRHYVSNSEGTGQPLGINESFYRNTNQGNGLAPLSR